MKYVYRIQYYRHTPTDEMLNNDSKIHGRVISIISYPERGMWFHVVFEKEVKRTSRKKTK